VVSLNTTNKSAEFGGPHMFCLHKGCCNQLRPARDGPHLRSAPGYSRRGRSHLALFHGCHPPPLSQPVPRNIPLTSRNAAVVCQLSTRAQGYNIAHLESECRQENGMLTVGNRGWAHHSAATWCLRMPGARPPNVICL